jgi:hypothetical protein
MAGGDMTTREEYQILTRSPRDAAFKVRRFTGYTDRDKATILRRLARERGRIPPGWELKLRRRLVITITSEWRDEDET